MSQTIRERLALADEQNRRALTQRLLRAGQEQQAKDEDERRRALIASIENTMRAAHESDMEALRSMSMIAHVLAAVVFAVLCAFIGVIALDYATDGRAFGSPAPSAIGRAG
jgi:hypothetical protein